MSDLTEFVYTSNATLTTDSKRVARHFRKRHDNVLRAFDNLGCSDEYRRLNFEAVEELDAKGERRRVLRMTKDGFMILVMGFTGKEAMRIKEAYIAAFNAMAEQLQSLSMSLWEQRMALEKRDATSFMWASFGSQRMLDRRRELPGIADERTRLDQQMQPALFKLERQMPEQNDLRGESRGSAANERRSKPSAA